LLTQVRVLVQQEREAAALDEVLRSRFAPQGGLRFHHEVVGKQGTKGGPRASHGGHPFRCGKEVASRCCLL
jgi:hypothetical protein